MTLETYLLYLAAVAVFFATPPDTSQLLVVANSMRHGLRRSAFTIAGDLSANCLQMAAAAFGLAAAIAASATAFLWIKWLGVAYLAWIGLRLLLAREAANGNAAPAGSSSAFQLFRQGFVTSMANPFAVVFFAALFPQFIDAGAPIMPQLVVLGATYLVIDAATLIVWGWLGTRARRHLTGFSAINRVCGALMIAAAGLLALKDIEPRPAGQR